MGPFGNVLISSAGRRVSLVRAFQLEARARGGVAMVHAADAVPELSAACAVADGSARLPLLDDPSYVADLQELCERLGVGLVIPTIDTELLLLAESRDALGAAGIDVSVSDAAFVRQCRDKRLTHELFAALEIDVPRYIDKRNPTFPLFVKPVDGSCSIDTYLAADESMLNAAHCSDDRFLFLEAIDRAVYDEYTLDLYYDRSSRLRCVVPRKRIAVRSGEVVKGVTERNDLVEYVRDRMSILPGARGCVTMQLFRECNGSSVYGIEINARFGGGYPLSYRAGANFPGWLLDEHFAGAEIPDFDGWEENLLLLRYDDEVLVHDYRADP